MRTPARSFWSKTTDGVRRGVAWVTLAVTACGARTGPSAPAPPPADTTPAPRAGVTGGARYALSAPVIFRGACDASGAAGLPGGLVVVADDEDNRLRVYDAARGGIPVDVIDTGPHLAGTPGAGSEMDLEGAATVGSRVYWIASHARKKSGALAPSRLNLFASDIVVGAGGRLAFVGRPYSRLLEDLVRDPALARYDLGAAAKRSPIAPGGLNIEGLTDTPEDGHLLLGFRNPVPGGRALLVPITNPVEVVERAGSPRFGAPLEVNLEGRGLRTIATWDGVYWIVGGSVADPTLASRLYRWDGTGPPVWIDSVDLGDLNVEAIATVTLEGRSRLLLVSDDGSRVVQGKRCKKLRDDAAKSFRAVWLIEAP